MPHRLRLALWYGGLTGAVVILISVLAYVAHVRAHYEEVDANLAGVAAHAVSEYVTARETGGNQTELIVSNNSDATIRIIDPNNQDGLTTSESEAVPIVDPLEILSHPSKPPYDLLARIVPLEVFTADLDSGSFGLAVGNDGARWRIYVRQINDENIYVVAETSLALVDESVQVFRRIMIAVVVLGAIVTLGGGWFIAGRALRPVSQVTDTAGAIARLRTFDRRVPVEGNDELADMADTFNEMLDTLEIVYQQQQQFVSDASHELRAPLTAIQANLEFLERYPEMPSGERDEVLEEAIDETHRLTRLVGDLLALARADAGMTLRLQPIEFDRLVLDAINEVRHLAQGRQIEIERLDSMVIDGDPDRLKQLLIILLDNAMKYTLPDGSVAVAAYDRSGTVELVIRDTGVGITDRDLPHIFERFYRADPARSRDPGGTGLGLSIAQWIVEEHQGNIAIESDLDQGTTVTVFLPSADNPKTIT